MNTEKTEEQKYEEFMALSEGTPEAAPPTEAAAAPEPAPNEAPPAEAPPDEPFPGFNALPDDIKAQLSEKLQAAAKATEWEKERREYENRLRAQTQNVAPLQRQVAELQKQLKTVQEAKPPAISKEKLEAWRANLPEESEVVLGLVSPLQEKLQTLEEERAQMLRTMQELQVQQQKTRDIAALNQFRPDWQETLPVLEKWISAHENPRTRERLARQRMSDNLDDVLDLWDQFGKEEELSKAWSQLQQQQPTPTKSRKPDVDPNPRIRQSSPSQPVNAMSPEEERFAKFSDDLDNARRSARH
jgi:hypothetical protein